MKAYYCIFYKLLAVTTYFSKFVLLFFGSYRSINGIRVHHECKVGIENFFLQKLLIWAKKVEIPIWCVRILSGIMICLFDFILNVQEIKRAMIRNRYNQVPHLTKMTNGTVTNSQSDIINESQEVSPFPAGDHKATINRRALNHIMSINKGFS